MNCWERQKVVLSNMLRSSEATSQWKILIFDNRGRTIMSRIFHEASLEKLQVTLFLSIKEKRSHVADVSAVYFVEPTKENFDIIINDAETGVYEFFYLNFTNSISRGDLDYFAEKVAQKELAHKFEKVFDQYTDFISLDPQLFCFDIPDFFYRATSKFASDDDQMQLLNSTVDSIFSLCVTMEALPVLCYSKGGGASKYVSDALTTKLRAGRQSLLPFSPRVPLLLIVERDIDISSVLRHGATYQALVHDIVGIENNKIKFTKEGQTVRHYLDSADEFWMQTKGLILPEVDEKFKEMLEEYGQRKDRMTKNENIEELADKIGMITDVNRQKDIVDKHSDILQHQVAQALKDRDIADFYLVEEDLLNQVTVSMDNLLSVLDKGSPEDKLRLLIIHYLCKGDGEEHVQLLDAASKYEIDFSALKWVKDKRELQNRRVRKSPADPSIASLAGNLFGKVKDATKKLIKGNSSKCEITRLLSRLMQTNTDEDFVYQSLQGGNQLPPNFTEAIVCVWGGGSYVEFQNLQDWKDDPSSVVDSIVYGSTHMPTPSQFIEELSSLGQNKKYKGKPRTK